MKNLFGFLLLLLIASACIEGDLENLNTKNPRLIKETNSIKPTNKSKLIEGSLMLKFKDGLDESKKEEIRQADFASFVIQKITVSTKCENVEQWMIIYDITGQPGPEDAVKGLGESDPDGGPRGGEPYVSAVRLNYFGNCLDL